MSSVKKTSFLIMGTSLILGMTEMAVSQTVPDEAAAPADDELQQIVVTGTLIKQRDLNSAVPISVVNADSLQATGTLEVVQAFRNLPEFGAGSLGTEVNIGGGGGQILAMRNLGAARTLILVNGHRMAGFTDGTGNSGSVVDISMIPQSLITRVDVERDGAGPTYGSDAVAGVVNFILDDTFRGFRADSNYGISGQGDGRSYRLSSKLGFGNEQGSMVVSADWAGKDDIRANERDWMLNQISSLTSTVVHGVNISPGGQVLGANGRTVLACYAPGGGANQAPNCPFYDPNAAGLYDINTGNTMRSLGAVGHYNITDNITFKGQLFYTQRDSDMPIGAYSFNTTTTLGPYPAGFTIPATSSSNPFGQNVGIRWFTLQAGNMHMTTDVNHLWSTFGFAGTLADRWNWEVSQTNSRTYSDQQYTYQPIASHLRNLFTPELCNADILCKPVGAIGNIQSFFAGGGQLTDAQRNYGWFDQLINSTYQIQQTTGTINGPIAHLPAGDMQAALGVELNRSMGSQLPDAITQTADSARLQNIPWDAGYRTKEAFAEIQAPLLKDARFARSLDLDLQARYTNFSASGTALDDATTWKVGLSYAPSDDIRFRAAYGTSFRAPTPFDLFRGGNVSTGTGTDPCNPGGLRAANATINANCIAAGAPTGPVPASTTVQLNAGGSPALQPEEGKSFTIGTVLTPTFLPRLNMTLDYYHITLTDAIGQTNLSQALQACYSDPNFMARAANPLDACFGYSSRNPDETLARINQYSININRLEAEGIDYSSSYSIPSLGPVPGSLSLDVKLQYIISNFNSGSNLTEARGTFGSPTWSGTFTPTYRVGQFTVAWMARFASGMEDPGIRTGTVPRTNPLGYSGTGTYVVNNLTVRWQGENAANPYVMLGINNVLDKDPPFTTGFIGTRMFNTQPVTYDVVGRYFFVNAGVRF